jgi:hypothetical protein
MIVSQKHQDLVQPNSRYCFSKILRTFYASRKSWKIVVFLLATLKEKLPIFLINTLLLLIPLLVLTDRQNYRWTELQRNKYTRCAWAGGTFFLVVLLCQFLAPAGNRFWFYLLCTYVLRVQYSCGVVLVFWFWREIVFGVTYVLSVQYSYAVVSVFLLWLEIVLKMRTCFYKKILLGYLLWSARFSKILRPFCVNRN